MSGRDAHMDGWGRLARMLAALIRRLAPRAVADDLLRDIDDGFRTRRERTAGSAQRWLLRQLLLALRPEHLLELRRMDTVARRRSRIERGTRALLRSLGGVATDLRYSARLLKKSPGFTLLSVLVLAGGLGVSIFVFSILYTAMYKPLPLPEGDRIVRIVGIDDGGWMTSLDAVELTAIRDELESFERIGAWETRYVRIRGEHEIRSLYGTYTEAVMFEVAGVPPLLGRRLLPRDSAAGAQPVAVLSHSLWSAGFGADPGIVGSQFEINGESTLIAGVMPEGFGFPLAAQLWLPLEAAALTPYERGRGLNVYGKLHPGVGSERANGELHTAIQSLRADVDDPGLREELPRTAEARTFQKTQFGEEAGFLSGTLHLAAGLILLLAGVNAGNMLLARGLERSREISVRMALGAPRFRLVVQMMGEGILVSAVAGTLALAGAGYALSVFDDAARSAFPEGLAFWWRWGLDGPTVAATAALVVGTMLLVGGVPAWRVTRSAAFRAGSVAHVLQGVPARGRVSRGDRISRFLVVGNIAVIALLLFLGGATALVNHRAGNLDLGLATERILVANIGLPESGYPSAPSRTEVLRKIADRLTGSSAVEGVQIRSFVGGEALPIEAEGAGAVQDEQRPKARVRAVMGDPDLLGVELLAGRRLEGDLDTATSEPTAVVSRSLARTLWSDRSPLGRRIRIDDRGPEAEGRHWRVVVGVVSDVVEGNPLARTRHHDSVYVPLAQIAPAAASVTFRHRGDPRAATSAFHESLAEVAPGLVPERIESFDEMFHVLGRMASAANRVLLGCFGFALLLAVGGIYGLTARNVARRVREVGVRRALGATDGQVLRLFLRGGARRLVIGLGAAGVVGTILAVAVTRYLALEASLFAATGAGVAVLISAIVMTATWVPSRRAVRLPPHEAILRD